MSSTSFSIWILPVCIMLGLASACKNTSDSSTPISVGAPSGPTGSSPASPADIQAYSCDARTPLAFLGLDSIDQVGGTSLRLNWTPVTGAANYQVFKIENGVSSYIKAVDSPSRSTSVSGLLPSTLYRFLVRMVDQDGKIDANTVTREATTLTLPSPSEIPGLLLWFQADQINGTPNSGIADGTLIGTWSDRSGNAFNLTQTTPSLQPKLRTTAMAGQAAVEFNGSNSEMRVEFTNPQVLPESGYTFAIVFKTSATRGSMLTVVQPTTSNASSHDRQFGLDPGAPGKISDRVWNNEIIRSTTPFNDSQAHAGIVSVGARDRHRLFVDSKLLASGTKSSSDFHWKTGIMIGNHNYWGAFSGLISEILIYDQELSDADRQTLESYLLGKYGITPPASP